MCCMFICTCMFTVCSKNNFPVPSSQIQICRCWCVDGFLLGWIVTAVVSYLIILPTSGTRMDSKFREKHLIIYTTQVLQTAIPVR